MTAKEARAMAIEAIGCIVDGILKDGVFPLIKRCAELGRFYTVYDVTSLREDVVFRLMSDLKNKGYSVSYRVPSLNISWREYTRCL